MVGFNNLYYDYPLIHYLLSLQGGFTAAQAYQKSKQIIDTPYERRFDNVIWDRNQIVRQIDLMKMHGFDNDARRMSLKMVEIALRMDMVQDLPFRPGTMVGVRNIPTLLGYNRHDVKATGQLLDVSQELIDLRLEIGAQLGVDLMNKSDIDLGGKFFIERLEKAQPGITGTKGRGPTRVTIRSQVVLGQLVLPVVQFDHPEFQRIHRHFLTTPPITRTKGVFDKLVAECYGLEFKFGQGGIHAATESKTYRARPGRRVITVDVTSYYPNLAIKWGLHPEHLGQAFVREYEAFFRLRQSYKKGTNPNTAVKLGLNAVFGKSGSKFSCMHDLNFLMSITINGQLLLCMLAEKLAQIPTAEVFNVNTDGVTMAIDEAHMGQVDAVCRWWEGITRLNLEQDDWQVIFQRDVNSYLGVEVGGKVKGKGAFEWRHGTETKQNWHKDQSAKIVTKAAEEFLVKGTPIEQTVALAKDPFDFLYTVKVRRTDRLMFGGYLDTYDDHVTPSKGDAAKGKPTARPLHRGGKEVQRTGRYYVCPDYSPGGDYLYKIMPPLAVRPNHLRPQAVQSGERVILANNLSSFSWLSVSHEHYIEAARDLVRSTGTFA